MKISSTLQRLDRYRLGLLLLCCLLFFWRLGAAGLTDPDEGRYAEIAREMLVLKDYLTPHLNFLPYLEKPPLVYWLTAVTLSLGGLNEWAARAVPALSALGGVLAVYWFAAKLWGTRIGFWAGMVTATSSGYFLLARLLTLDMSLTCFMTWGIVLAYVAVRNGERQYLPWAYLSLGLAVLTKGPVGVVLPGFIFAIYFLTRKQLWQGIRQLWHTGGVLLLAVVVLPWYILVGARNLEFWRYFFWHENVQRFLTPEIHAGQPVYFYFGVLAAGFLPWFFLLPWAWQNAISESASPEEYQDRFFLLIWFGTIFLFFSLARSKLFPYLLPGLPPLATLIALGFFQRRDFLQFQRPLWKWTLIVWLSLAVLGLLTLSLVAVFVPLWWSKISVMGPHLIAYCLVLTVTAALLLFGLPAPGHRPYLLLGSALLLSLVLLFTWEQAAAVRSPKPLAQTINSRSRPDDIIIGFQYYSQALSFYTQKPLYLFQTRGELEFGLEQQPNSPYYLRWPRQLPELLRQHLNFFVILKNDNMNFFQNLYSEPITILDQWKNYILIGKS